jgi:hypothetical protein
MRRADVAAAAEGRSRRGPRPLHHPAPAEKDDLTPLSELALIAFPVRELFQVKLREFDLIVFDRFANRGILPPSYLRNIADYVRAGGALLLAVGPEFAGAVSLAATPLGRSCRPGPCRRSRPSSTRPTGRASPSRARATRSPRG